MDGQRFYSLLMIEKETHSLASWMHQQIARDLETELKQVQEKESRLPMSPEVMAQFYGERSSHSLSGSLAS